MCILCRLCGQKIAEKPLIEYKNMPKSAQNFPTASALDADRGDTLTVLQCSSCGLLQLAGEPVPYYREVIRASGFSPEMATFRENQFKNFVDKFFLADKRVIEIGAGKGEYMKWFSHTGARVYGLEYAATDNLRIFKGFPEHGYQIPDAPYAAFFIMNFLEHIPNPKEFLHCIADNLEDGGYGLVEVPNVDMILRERLFTEFISDHLMYFTQKTLTLMLETNGFDVLDCGVIWYDYIISAVVRKRTPIDVSGFEWKQRELTEALNNYLDEKITEKKVTAVWGAGHQALATIALTEIKNKIKFVIDSATFKQGKYTMATHIPIVAPQKINELGIANVIVMAAGYSDEIVNILQNDYPSVDIAVLRESGLEVVS